MQYSLTCILACCTPPLPGHGSGATDQVGSALSELVRVAEEGQLDVNYGERQLRVAAIRLREHPEYICEVGSVVREEQCGAL